jgi:hypothetical protein
VLDPHTSTFHAIKSHIEHGRVFAYGVTLVPVVIDRNLRTYAGAMHSLFYYDEDGTVCSRPDTTGLTIPKVPTWVGSKRLFLYEFRWTIDAIRGDVPLVHEAYGASVARYHRAPLIT